MRTFFNPISMAWSTNDILEFTKFLLRKNQSGSISATNLFYAWNSEQSTFFQDLKGRWQSRNSGKLGLNTGLIQNETIMTMLSPFTLTDDLDIVGGSATKPTDFSYRLAVRINGVDALKINHNQIGNVNDSVIDPPSIADNKFFFVEYGNTFFILPNTLPTATITTLQLDYLKQPTDIVWGYTYNAASRQVYNPGTSTNPEWQNTEIVEITKRTLATFGISYHDKDLEQFAAKTIITGD